MGQDGERKTMSEQTKITQNYRVLTPAYGRDYKNGKAAIADFENGKDFQLQPDGCYCGKSDFAPGVKVNIRYARMTKVVGTVVK